MVTSPAAAAEASICIDAVGVRTTSAAIGCTFVDIYTCTKLLFFFILYCSAQIYYDDDNDNDNDDDDDDDDVVPATRRSSLGDRAFLVAVARA